MECSLDFALMERLAVSTELNLLSNGLLYLKSGEI